MVAENPIIPILISKALIPFEYFASRPAGLILRRAFVLYTNWNTYICTYIRVPCAYAQYLTHMEESQSEDRYSRLRLRIHVHVLGISFPEQSDIIVCVHTQNDE